MPVSVGTVSAQFGLALGTRPGTIDAVRIEKGLKKYHRRDRELLKEKGCTAVVSCTMVHVGRFSLR